ncbi:MAG: hypothetical protein Q8L46_02085 [candidate division WWE3 bacterium]|nr:hypothetical protein [candidate division WWE3 bacterium]
MPDLTKHVKLILKPGYFPKVFEGIPPNKAVIWDSRLVFRITQAEAEFRGSWRPFLELFNAAAAVNALFVVILTPEEYARLAGGGLERLKKRLSRRAASFLRLYGVDEVWPCTDGRPTLELLRTSRCP